MVSRAELVEENRPVPRLIRLGVGNVLGFYCVTLMPFTTPPMIQTAKNPNFRTHVASHLTRDQKNGLSYHCPMTIAVTAHKPRPRTNPGDLPLWCVSISLR
jgi:hypothetical protein